MADLQEDQALPAVGDVSETIDETAMPDDEREEILQEIETLVSNSQPTKQIASQYRRPRRSGVGFPIILNLVAAAAIVAGIYFITEYFRVREDSIALESRSYFSAEAQLIEEILRESEQRIAQKDQEIGQIQSQLALLDEEKRSLEANLQDQVAEREAELRAQLNAELAAERARLAGEGQSEADINARLAEIEAAREAEFQQQIEGFRAEAQAELDQLAAELDARESQLEQTLEASQEERTRIAAEAASREEELREELGAEIEALEEEQQAAQDRISELQSLREEEALLADRVLGSFAVIVEDIQEGRSEEALSGLGSLERLLRNQTAVDSESEQQRRTQLALASTLRGLVQEVDVLRSNIAVRALTTSDEETASIEQQRAAELIATAAGVVDLAEEAREAGRLGDARNLYQQALSTIPSLEKVYPGILDLESARRRVIMSSAVGEARNLLASGSSEAAVSRYLGALEEISEGDDDPLLAVAEGLQEATDANGQAVLAAQQAAQDELQGEVNSRDRQIQTLNQQLLTSRNQVSSRDATISELQNQVQTLTNQLATREEAISGRAEELSRAQARVTELEDQLSTLRVDLQSETARAASLQASLAEARDEASSLAIDESSLQNRIDDLDTEITSLRGQLTTARQRAQTAEGEAAALRTTRETLTTQVTELETLSEEYEARIAELEDTASEYEDQLAALEEELAGLEQELAARPQAETGEVPAVTQAEIDTLNSRIATLNETIDQRESRIATLTSTIAENDTTIAGNNRTISDLNEQIDGLEATVAGLNDQIDQLSGTVSQTEESSTGLEAQLATARQDLRAAVNERDSLETDLETARQRVSGLQTQIENLRGGRDTATTRIAGLQDELETLTEETEILRSYRDRIESLTDVYERAQTSAVRFAAADNFESARDRILQPLATDTANEILPAIATNIDQIYAGLISQVQSQTSGEARQAALADIQGFTQQVKQNIDNPESSLAVESYLQREPDIASVASEIFEIIELSSRDLTAPEIEYSLLGSVSRTTAGNLIVVERLVVLESQIGDTVEIRRSPELGQEEAIALGTIIEVTDTRVVVSVEEVYQPSVRPGISDLVYQQAQ